MAKQMNEASFMTQFMTWASKMDKETMRLTGRVFAKGVATGDMNGFIKKLMLKELGEIDDDEKTINTTLVEPKT